MGTYFQIPFSPLIRACWDPMDHAYLCVNLMKYFLLFTSGKVSHTVVFRKAALIGVG